MQIPLFSSQPSVEEKVQAILARRRIFNCGGQDGEDWHLIYAAISKAEGGAA